MQIVRVTAYRQFQPFADGPYIVSGGRAEEGFNSTIVRLETDNGLIGWGEAAPLGTRYDAAYPEGFRAPLPYLAEAVMGSNPFAHRDRVIALDRALKGHAYAKSALDMAAWDLAGKASGQPLAELSGGRFGTAVPLYRSLSQETPEAMAERAKRYAARGYRRLQVKVGGDPLEDAERVRAVAAAVGEAVQLYADANGGWLPEAALRFLNKIGPLDLRIEQPCVSLETCLAVRRFCALPMVLDESLDSLASLLRIVETRAADGITLKIARVGGVSRTIQLRDLAVDAGLAVTVEDTGGSDIDTAAMAHLSLSTPVHARAHTVDFNAWVTLSNADGMPPVLDGAISAPTLPGLGVKIREESLGEAIFTLG